MKIIKAEINGVYIVEPAVHQDGRGEFFRTFDVKLFAAAGIEGSFVQHNQSKNFTSGTWRGLHYQLPPSHEVKLIRCIRGKIFDVVLDLRKGSETFLQWRGFDLSEKNMRGLIIPAGCAHGFITLEDNAELIYHHTQFYNPEAEAGIRFNDPAIQLKLPVDVIKISPRDEEFPLLTAGFKGIEI
jgi:dTDP-4-dehydrorhamnose 3,5-epimerase